LTIPVTISVSHRQALLVDERMEQLRRLGFHVEPFGRDAFVVRAVPPFVSPGSEARLVQELFDGLAEGALPPHLPGDRLQATTACKAAVKKGDRLRPEEIQKLLDDWRATAKPLNCPHGCHNAVELSYHEQLRRFKRISWGDKKSRMSIPQRIWRIVRGRWLLADEQFREAMTNEAAAQELTESTRQAAVPGIASHQPIPSSTMRSDGRAVRADPLAADLALLGAPPACDLETLDRLYRERLAELHQEELPGSTVDPAVIGGRRVSLAEAYERLRDAINTTETRFEKLDF
jgi:hypothetical protein